MDILKLMQNLRLDIRFYVIEFYWCSQFFFWKSTAVNKWFWVINCSNLCQHFISCFGNEHFWFVWNHYPIILFLACLGISNPNTAGLTLAHFQNGKCIGINGCYSIGIRCFGFFCSRCFVKNSMLPMVLIMTVSTISTYYFDSWKTNIKKNNLSKSRNGDSSLNIALVYLV
jgi:hypothetical protein